MSATNSIHNGLNERHISQPTFHASHRHLSLPTPFRTSHYILARRATSQGHFFEDFNERANNSSKAELQQRARTNMFSMQRQEIEPSIPSTLLPSISSIPTCPSLCSDSVYSVASTPRDGSLSTRYFPLTNSGEVPYPRHFQVRDLAETLGHEVLGRLMAATMHRADTIAAAMRTSERLRYAINTLAARGLAGVEDAAVVIRAEVAPPDLPDYVLWFNNMRDADSVGFVRGFLRMAMLHQRA